MTFKSVWLVEGGAWTRRHSGELEFWNSFDEMIECARRERDAAFDNLVSGRIVRGVAGDNALHTKGEDDEPL